MTPRSEYVCIYRAPHAIEGNLIKGLLERAGIPVRLSGESLVGAYSGVPLAADVRVSVPVAHEGAGRQLIEAFRQPKADAGQWQCGGCNEQNDSSFETCWNCGADATA